VEWAFQILPHIYLDIEDTNFKAGKNKGLHRGWKALAFSYDCSIKQSHDFFAFGFRYFSYWYSRFWFNQQIKLLTRETKCDISFGLCHPILFSK